MNAGWIIAAFILILIDTVLERLKHRHHALVEVPDADILSWAIVAIRFFKSYNG